MQINTAIQLYKKNIGWDFAGGPTVKTLPSNAGGGGSIPGPEAKIPLPLSQKNQSKKQKQWCNKFNKDFKNDLHQKNLYRKERLSRGVGLCVYALKVRVYKIKILVIYWELKKWQKLYGHTI